MSKILKLVKKHFKDDAFYARDFSSKTGIDIRTCNMVLKRLSNSLKLGIYANEDQPPLYYYRTTQDINKERIEVNKMIDKYNLKQKKFKIIS